MTRPFWNPKQSDYPGRYKLAGIALAVGLLLLVVGLSSSSEIFTTLLSSAGVGLVIGGCVVAYSAWRSQQRAEQTKGD